MLHPYVIDTSVIFNLSGYRKRKCKLSTLSAVFLKIKIQQEKTTSKQGVGHDPIEDARAAM